MCVVNAPSTLALIRISYTWRRNGADVHSGQTNQLIFNSLPLSEDNAVYTCQYRASSVYLNKNVVKTSPGFRIRIICKFYYLCNRTCSTKVKLIDKSN